MKKRVRLVFLAMLICLLWNTGCGKEEAITEKWGYGLTEYVLPNPNEGMDDSEAIEEKVYAVCEGQVVRISQTQKMDGNKILSRWYIQTLQEPYECWDTYVIEQNVTWNNQLYVIGNCCVTFEGDIFFLMYNSEEETCFLAQWREGTIVEACEILLDTALFFCNWEIDAGGNSYFYGNNVLRVFNAAFQEQMGFEAAGELLDLLMTPEGEAYAWYVRNSATGTMRIQAVDDRRELVNEDTLKNTLADFVLTIGENGEIYQAGTERCYQLGNKKEVLFSYVELGTWIETIADMQYFEANGLQILASDGNDRLLLFIREGMQPVENRKEEIVLVAESNSFLEKCIVAFNKKSEKYYITLEAWDSDLEYYDEFCSRIQLEVSAGGGPDLIEASAVMLDSYARGGYLEPLDDLVVKSDGKLVEAAVESGKVDDKYYVMPYRFKLDTMMTLKETLQEAEGWTLEQLKEVLTERESEALYVGARAWDVLYICIVMDEESKDFVDWESGECHFDSEEFVELLYFSEKYADSQNALVSDMELDKMKNNEILTKRVYGISSVETFLLTIDELEGEGTFIGYPVKAGNGTYVDGIGFALNSSSKCKEGAKEFLEYLISEEVQFEMGRSMGFLPVNKEALQQTIEAEITEGTALGKKYFTKEQSDEFWALLEKSKPAGKNYANIVDILYEETGAFYSGDKSAEEVAGIIQNRVQLYLDEQK